MLYFTYISDIAKKYSKNIALWFLGARTKNCIFASLSNNVIPPPNKVIFFSMRHKLSNIFVHIFMQEGGLSKERERETTYAAYTEVWNSAELSYIPRILSLISFIKIQKLQHNFDPGVNNSI